MRVSHRESQSEPERARVSQREHELYRLQSCIRECFAKKIKMEAIRRCRLRAVSQKMKILRGKLTPQIIPPCEEVNLVRTLNPLGSVVPLAMFCCRNVNFNYQSTHSVFLTALLILSTIKYFRFFSKAFLLYILSRKKHSELEGESVHFFFTLQNSHFQSH